MSNEKHIILSLEKARSMYGRSTEMDELLLANFSEYELTKKALPKSWNEFKAISGFWINNGSDIKSTGIIHIDYLEKSKNVFATKKQAKSALAMAQLSQLMAVYNDGWEPDWTDTSDKFILFPYNKKICSGLRHMESCFIAFKSEKIAAEFQENFESLIKEYFMID